MQRIREIQDDVNQNNKARGGWRRPDNLAREQSGKRISKAKQRAMKRMLTQARNGTIKWTDDLRRFAGEDQVLDTVCWLFPVFLSTLLFV
jgi:hypothetical protein